MDMRFKLLANNTRHVGVKQPILSICALVAVAALMGACSGGGGSEDTTSLNTNLRTTDSTADTSPSTAETSSSTSSNSVAASLVSGYLTVPSGLRAGQTATIEGHGYKPQSSYFLTIQDPAGGVSTQNVSVSDNGSFQFQLTLPQAGIYTATAVDNATGVEVGNVIVSAMSDEF